MEDSSVLGARGNLRIGLLRGTAGLAAADISGSPVIPDDSSDHLRDFLSAFRIKRMATNFIENDESNNDCYATDTE